MGMIKRFSYRLTPTEGNALLDYFERDFQKVEKMKVKRETVGAGFTSNLQLVRPHS